MSEHLSQPPGPNFSFIVSDHENCRDNVHAALNELRSTTDSTRVRWAAQQLVEQQMRLPDTYEHVAIAYISNGLIDSWIDDFVYQDEQAIDFMMREVSTDGISHDYDSSSHTFFSQMSRDGMHRLALEYVTEIMMSQPVHDIDTYIAPITPKITGRQAIKYEYGFRINSAIDNLTETLPASTQVVIAQEREIYHFREKLNETDDLFEHKELVSGGLDDGQLIILLLGNSLQDPTLSQAIGDYEDAKTTFAASLEQLSQTSPVRNTIRHDLYRKARKDIDALSYRFNSLCDILYKKYDKKMASRIMAAHWRQDRELLNSIINSLSDGNDELPGAFDVAIDTYSDYFMGITPPDNENFGGELPSQLEVIDYYTNALESLFDKVKNLRYYHDES